jgi:predicted metalloprotease with PDZ domain
VIPALLVAAALRVADAGASPEAVAYRVEIGRDPRLRIEILVPPAASTCPRTLVMPRAIPMGYGEQAYDRFVEGLRAFGKAGEALAVKREEGPRFILCAKGQSLARVAYEVDLARMEEAVLSASDASKWRDGYVSLLGYSVFGFVEGLEGTPAHLDARAPDDWPIVSTLAPSVQAPRGHASASAADYYVLADSQIIAGPRAQWRTLRNAPTPVFLSLYSEAEGEIDVDLLGQIGGEAFDAVVAYFGSAPFAHYTMQQEYLRPRSEAHRYGMSMEHLESATFYLAADQALRPTADEAARARIRYNFAHHIAHAWIPKRCAGPGYFPFQWELAPLLDSIWFAEGFGQYAAADALAARFPPAEAAAYRDVIVRRRFRESLAEAPAFLLRMPLVELSYVASTRYAEDFRTGRTVFARGGLMAAEMDQEIRKATANRKSLRDGLRALVAWSAHEQRPFAIADLPDHMMRATGVDVRKIYERWLAPVTPP